MSTGNEVAAVAVVKKVQRVGTFGANFSSKTADLVITNADLIAAAVAAGTLLHLSDGTSRPAELTDFICRIDVDMLHPGDDIDVGGVSSITVAASGSHARGGGVYEMTGGDGSEVGTMRDAAGFFVPADTGDIVVRAGSGIVVSFDISEAPFTPGAIVFPPPEPPAWMLGYTTTAANDAIAFTVTSAPALSAFIDWGDGTSGTYTGPNFNHVYADPGTYAVLVVGWVAGVVDLGGSPFLTDVYTWFTGPEQILLNGSPALATVPWNLPASVTSMQDMFRDTAIFNGDLSLFDTTAVTNMDGAFFNAAAFDGDLSGWVVTAIPAEPTDWDTGSLIDGVTAKQPNWGV